MIGFSLVESCHVPVLCFRSQYSPSSFLFWISDVCNKVVSFFFSTSSLYLLVLLIHWKILKKLMLFTVDKGRVKFEEEW